MNKLGLAVLALVFGVVFFWADSRDAPIEQTTSEVIQEGEAPEEVAKNPFLTTREWEPFPDQPFDRAPSIDTEPGPTPSPFISFAGSESKSTDPESPFEDQAAAPTRSTSTDQELERAFEALFDLQDQGQGPEDNLPAATAQIPPVAESEPLPEDIMFDRPDSLIGGGVRRADPAPEIFQEIANELPEDEEEQEEDEPAIWYRGQARGYTLLSLMQPEARQSTEVQIATMLQSRVRELYLGVLTDGTFSWDPQYLESVVRRLNREERELTLVLYLSNGATMRAYADTPIDVAFNTIAPEDFRELIRFDSSIRGEFVALAQRVRPIFELNRSLNPANRNIAIVMLEDNLTRESYAAMRSLAAGVLGDLVEFARNPCLGCYPDNDGDSLGDFLEFHSPEELSILGVGEGYSLDGAGYALPFESNVRGVSVDQVQNMIAQSLIQELAYFGLWRFDRQGLHLGQNIPPEDREYVVPTEQHIEAELELLRFGLTLSEDTED